MSVGRHSAEPTQYLLSIQRRNFLFDFSRLDGASPCHYFIDLPGCALLTRFEQTLLATQRELFAARHNSTSVAPGFPINRFSRLDPLNKKLSCVTTPIA